MITVLMMVHFDKSTYDELENVKLSVESFRLLADEEIVFVIVDNRSVDGWQEWVREQTDLTYVLLDEGDIGYGKAINMVRKELEIDTDLLIIESSYLLTPRCLSRLKELLYAKEETGAVCGTVYYAGYNDLCGTEYNMAIEMANTMEGAKGSNVLLPDNSAILWKKNTIDMLGDFDEEIGSMHAALDDYSIRVIMSDRKIKNCANAFFWSMGNIQVQYIRLLDNNKALEKKWGMHYFNRRGNMHLIQQVDEEAEEEFSVLEVGCDCGATLLEIKNRYPRAKVYGCEINEMAAKIASHVAAEVAVCNIEDKSLPFAKKKFKYIIFGDVLEHLHNPLEVLVYCKEFLCEGGYVIASIPNIMHISVMEELLKGNFTYTETGLLDKTHIHFFTYNEIIRMFTEAGYHINRINSINVTINAKQQELIDGLLALGNAERGMFEAFQYNVKANLQVAYR